MLIWVLPVQLEAPLLERLGEACTDSRDLLLRELLTELGLVVSEKVVYA